MGKVIRYTHKKCGFELDFLEGVGFSLIKMQKVFYGTESCILHF